MSKNLKYIPTWKIREILAEPYCRGIDGKDYEQDKDELAKILWQREDKIMQQQTEAIMNRDELPPVITTDIWEDKTAQELIQKAQDTNIDALRSKRELERRNKAYDYIMSCLRDAKIILNDELQNNKYDFMIETIENDLFIDHGEI